MAIDHLFKEWLIDHAATNLSERYATDAVRWWDREIAPAGSRECASLASPTTRGSLRASRTGSGTLDSPRRLEFKC